jgi:polysaccharide pyruvyl transferase WcaK-like protein
MKRILIKGYYGFGNFGDDLLLKVSYGILRKEYPNAHFIIYSENSPNNWQFSEEEGFNNYIFKILDAELPIVDWTFKGEVDLLFNGGGGIYNDLNKGGFKFNLLNTLAKRLNPHKVYYIEKFFRKAVNRKANIQFKLRIGYGLGIGPFTPSAPSFIHRLSEIGTYDSIFVRDNESFEFLQSINFKNSFHCYTDIAFHTSYWLDKNKKKKRFGSKKNKIGIILLDWPGKNDEFFANFRNIGEELKNVGFPVQYISFHKGYDQGFQRFFKDEIIAWDPHTMELESFLEILNEQNLLITARAHGAIVGACLGVPSICLKVSSKLEQISKMLPDSSVLISPPFCQSEIVAEVKNIFKNYVDVEKSLRKDVSLNVERAEKGEKVLKTFL